MSVWNPICLVRYSDEVQLEIRSARRRSVCGPLGAIGGTRLCSELGPLSVHWWTSNVYLGILGIYCNP